MKKKRFLATVLTATLAIGMFAGCGKNEDAVEVAAVKSEEPSATGKDATKEAEKALKVTVTINVKADKGWDKDSTPAIAHIVSRDKKTDFYHAVRPDNAGSTGTTTVKLAGGNYNVGFVSPLNKDGSAYDVQGTGKAKEIELEVKTDAKDGVKVDCPMKQIPAEQVTDDMIKDIVEKTQDAVEKGDDTLKGDTGKEILETLDENVKQNPNVSEETKKETETVKDTAPVEDKKDNNDQTANNNTQNTNNQADTGKDNTQAAANNNQGSQPAKQPEKAPEKAPEKTPEKAPEKPVHQHAWKQHTTTVNEWVSVIVDVPIYDTVTTGSAWHCNCGAVVSYSDYEQHTINHMLNGEPDNGYDAPITETVIVGYDQQDQGHYETKTINDYQYCDCGAKR